MQSKKENTNVQDIHSGSYTNSKLINERYVVCVDAIYDAVGKRYSYIHKVYDLQEKSGQEMKPIRKGKYGRKV